MRTIDEEQLDNMGVAYTVDMTDADIKALKLSSRADTVAREARRLSHLKEQEELRVIEQEKEYILAIERRKVEDVKEAKRQSLWLRRCRVGELRRNRLHKKEAISMKNRAEEDKKRKAEQFRQKMIVETEKVKKLQAMEAKAIQDEKDRRYSLGAEGRLLEDEAIERLIVIEDFKRILAEGDISSMVEYKKKAPKLLSLMDELIDKHGAVDDADARSLLGIERFYQRKQELIVLKRELEQIISVPITLHPNQEQLSITEMGTEVRAILKTYGYKYDNRNGAGRLGKERYCRKYPVDNIKEAMEILEAIGNSLDSSYIEEKESRIVVWIPKRFDDSDEVRQILSWHGVRGHKRHLTQKDGSIKIVNVHPYIRPQTGVIT